MQTTKRFVLCLLWCVCASIAAGQAPSTQKGFVENRGQWDPRAQFLSRLPGVNVWVTADGLVLDYHQFTRTNKRNFNPKLDRAEGILKGQVIHMTFEGASQTTATGEGVQPGQFNYIRPKEKITGVSRFAEASAKEIYNGISARYYFENGSPRYDLVVQPGANPNQIGVRMEGANAVSRLANGNLRIDTNLGAIEEKGLTVYQQEGGKRHVIPSSMTVEEGAVHFHVGDYDRTKQLVIDPILYASYIGGSGGGIGDKVMAVTAPGNNGTSAIQYIAGDAESPNFPTTYGAYETSMAEGGQGFVAQINPYSGALNWCSLIEGSALNASAYVPLTSAVIDANGNVLVAGAFEDEGSFPFTNGAFQTGGGPTGNYTGFICRISQDGKSLLNGTYLSGTDGDSIILDMCLSSTGNVMVAGRTSSTTFPVQQYAMEGAQPAPPGGYSGFATVLTGDLTTLKLSTYYGGNGNTVANAIADGHNDDPVIAGTTWATNLNIGVNGFQQTNGAASGTGYVAEIHWSGQYLWQGTYVGGRTHDEIYSIYIDSNQDYICSGMTESDDFPVTQGCFQNTLNGSVNGFVCDIFYSIGSINA